MPDPNASVKAPHLSVVPSGYDQQLRLSRAEAAARLGVSVATVRRYEGSALHPSIDKSGAHWFSVPEVTALAASRANKALDRGSISKTTSTPEPRTRGELAALVFERFEQRYSLAEVVISLRVEPELVAELFEQYCTGLTERQLRKREPGVALISDVPQIQRSELAARLEGLSTEQVTRVSVARWRGVFPAGDDKADYAWVVELGGFVSSGPCKPDEITRRYGAGSYRITAFNVDRRVLLWEILIEDLE